MAPEFRRGHLDAQVIEASHIDDAEVGRLARLAEAIASQTSAGRTLWDEEVGTTFGADPLGWSETTDLESRRLLIGLFDGAPVALGAARRYGDARGRVGTILFVHVEDAARGIGVGGTLLDELARWAGEGTQRIDALALPGTRNWKALLEQAGFRARLLVLTPRSG